MTTERLYVAEYAEVLERLEEIRDGFSDAGRNPARAFRAGSEITAVADQVERKMLDRIHAGGDVTGADLAVLVMLEQVARSYARETDCIVGIPSVLPTVRRVQDFAVHRLVIDPASRPMFESYPGV